MTRDGTMLGFSEVEPLGDLPGKVRVRVEYNFDDRDPQCILPEEARVVIDAVAEADFDTELPLTAGECRSLAALLNRAAERAEEHLTSGR